MGVIKTTAREMTPTDDPAALAVKKMASGALMRIAEVGAVLDLAPATIHSLPLPSIRLGRSLRYDPADVRFFIESSKEAHLAKGGAHGR
jgi:hypothetical protein